VSIGGHGGHVPVRAPVPQSAATARNLRGVDEHIHSHAGAHRSQLVLALVLIGGFMVAEVVAGVASGSLALLADAGHMLADVGAIGAALWAWHLAERPAEGSWTFGFKRAEILSAAGNGILLLVVAVVVALVAIHRLIQPSMVHGLTMVIVAGVGVVVNLVAAWVLARGHRQSLNIEGAYQHIVTDLYGFIATLLAGLIILATGFSRADPIASLVVVVLMLRASWGLLKTSLRILLEAAPEAVDLSDVRAHLLEPAHVRDVHDLHVWTVTSDLPAISAHVVVDDSCFLDGHAPQVLDELQQCLAGHFDVEHSTFQLEPASHADHEPGTHR
jgi:cobalt-zinc-cadmium efflux system protein